ncbi:outer membrane beta-barrel protein [bacterium]|nr:outer membrane beta-barrel protein [bacterium]
MKILASFVLLMFVSFPIQAKKLRFGPALELGFTRPTQKENITSYGFSKAYGVCAGIGGKLLFEVNEKFLLDTGLYLTVRTAKHTYRDQASVETSFAGLEVPVVANWKLAQKEKYFYYVGLGINNAFGIGDIKVEAKALGQTGTASGSYKEANMTHYMPSLLLSNGWIFQVSEKIDLGLDFRLLFELLDREKSDLKGFNVWSFEVITSLLW